MVDVASFDNCSGISFDLSQESFGCEDLGENEVIITATDDYGNISTEMVLVTVNLSGIDTDFDGIDDACDDEVIDYIVVPNGFTPDGDGINDLFVITAIDGVEGAELTIFNRYGNLVFESDDYDNTWDGRSSVNDKLMPDGTYFYILEIPGKDSMSGYVYINRVY